MYVIDCTTNDTSKDLRLPGATKAYAELVAAITSATTDRTHDVMGDLEYRQTKGQGR